jgi:hypothetical protein
MGHDDAVQSDPMQRDPAPPASNTTGWSVLLWLAWVLVPAGLFVAAMGSLRTFFGELPTEAEEAQATRLLVLAAVAIPAIGLIRGRLPGVQRRRHPLPGRLGAC